MDQSCFLLILYVTCVLAVVFF